MTRGSLIAITTLIWGAGFAATGAFVYTVTQPLPPSSTVITIAPTSSPPRMPHARVEARTIVLPTMEIVGEVPHRSPTPRERHCSEWRPLQQGSNSVQICD